MTIAEMYLAEFEQEAITTRKFLEQLPADKLSWKPHEKSKSAGQLAMHIATAPGGIARMAQEDEFAMPEGGPPNPEPQSKEQVLAALESSIATVRELLPKLSDARMQGLWKMRIGGKDVLTLPRFAMLRSLLLNHWYHHRGQFGVYLRLLGAKVPSSYGPSGDEPPSFLQK